MFRLEHPYILYSLALIVVIGLLSRYVLNNTNEKVKALASISLWSSVLPGYNYKKSVTRSWIWLSGLVLIVISMSNPQWGMRKEKIEIKSTDIYLVIDISNSMLANDIKPNRLERAKLWGESLIRSLQNDRIGTVLFAGHAFLQSPLTTDYGSASLFVRSAVPDLITTQGTNISDAINICLENFPKNEEAQKVIILLSDGEDHDELAKDLAEKAKAQNVTIYTIGTGTSQGGFIPIILQNMQDYKRDENGKPVQTKLNKDILTTIAQSTHGKYFTIDDGDAIIPLIKDEIAIMTKQRVAERAYSEYESYYQYFLFPGLLLLLVEYLMGINMINKLRFTNFKFTNESK